MTTPPDTTDLLAQYEELRKQELQLLTARHEHDTRLQMVRFAIADVARQILSRPGGGSHSW